MADLLTRAAEIHQPTIFPPGFGGFEEVGTFDAMVARLRDLAAGRAITFHVATAAYPDLKPFAALTVRSGRDYVATVADRWHDEDDVRAARRTLEAAFRQDVAA